MGCSSIQPGFTLQDGLALIDMISTEMDVEMISTITISLAVQCHGILLCHRDV